MVVPRARQQASRIRIGLLAVLFVLGFLDGASADDRPAPARHRLVAAADLLGEPDAEFGSAEDKAWVDREPDGALDPAQRAEFLHRRGLARKALGRLREAVADFDEAVAIGRAAPLPFAKVGNAYYRE